VRDKDYGTTLALKVTYDAFHDSALARYALREMIFMMHLTEHENIITLVNVIRSEYNRDLYFILEYMETDLHVVIRANILEDVHKRYIIYQLLKALKYIHSANIIHCEIKPSNLLLNSDCCLKVSDFGLAKSIEPTANTQSIQNQILCDYVSVRWYKPPEIMLGSKYYTKAADMWSVGLVLGELIGCKPMFPGSSSTDMIDRIIQVLGRPNTQDIEDMQSEFAAQFFENFPDLTKTLSIESLYPTTDSETIDMLRLLLTWSPTKRISSTQALEHHYVAQFHDLKEEIECTKKLIPTYPLDNSYSLSTYREYCDSIIKDNFNNARTATSTPSRTKKHKSHRDKKHTNSKQNPME